MWTITCDHIDDGKCVGVCSRDFDEGKSTTSMHRFQLLDGDGEIYYEGMSDEARSQRAFEPLDDFGRGYAGCAQIQYLAAGIWQPL